MDTEITSTNPVAVGDEVEMMVEDNGAAASLSEVLRRRNYLVRSSPHNISQKHIIAANLDLAILVASIRDPRTSQGFIDRFLVTAAAYHIAVLILFNKLDIYRQKDRVKLDLLSSIYQNAGYQVLTTSHEEKQGQEALIAALGTGTTLFIGHSGVGKTSLINRIIPGMDLKTREISGWSGKGVHTTTFAEMYDLPTAGRVIDTPGIREFGIVDMSRSELSHYFPEMKALLEHCRFNNCVHLDEPGCAVKQALEAGRLHPERYISYVSILESL